MYFPKTPPGGRGAATLQVGLMGRGTQENPRGFNGSTGARKTWLDFVAKIDSKLILIEILYLCLVLIH